MYNIILSNYWIYIWQHLNFLTIYDKDKEKYYLNETFFVKFLENYWDKELFNMKENYMMNNYKMYKTFKNIFSRTSMNKDNNPNYVNHTNFEKINMTFKQYTSQLYDIIKNTSRNYEEQVNEQLYKIFLNKDYTMDDFLNQLKQLLQYDLFKNVVPSDIKGYENIKNYIILLNNKDFLKLFIPIAKINPEKKIVRSYKDILYNNTSKISRHQNNINNLIKKGEGTKFDKEYYIFSNMLDNYSDILKNNPLNLVNMIDNPEKTIGHYYKYFFNIDTYKFIDNKFSIRQNVQSHDLEHVIKKYIEGLLWTFNYYYNETNNISKWFYDDERAPIMRDIYIYIQNNPNCLKKIYNELKMYDVNLNNFFNPIEQLMYITPQIDENVNLIPKKYLHFFKTNDYYLDINNIINNMDKEIDCTGAKYLNKCLIKSLKNYDEKYDDEFIKQLRIIDNEQDYNVYKKKYQETGYIKFSANCSPNSFSALATDTLFAFILSIAHNICANMSKSPPW
jgi:hypothetical protein